MEPIVCPTPSITTTILRCVQLQKSADLKLYNTFKRSQKMPHIAATEIRVLMAPGKKSPFVTGTTRIPHVSSVNEKYY
jgi:hypothetical protein